MRLHSREGPGAGTLTEAPSEVPVPRDGGSGDVGGGWMDRERGRHLNALNATDYVNYVKMVYII